MISISYASHRIQNMKIFPLHVQEIECSALLLTILMAWHFIHQAKFSQHHQMIGFTVGIQKQAILFIQSLVTNKKKNLILLFSFLTVEKAYSHSFVKVVMFFLFH